MSFEIAQSHSQSLNHYQFLPLEGPSLGLIFGVQQSAVLDCLMAATEPGRRYITTIIIVIITIAFIVVMVKKLCHRIIEVCYNKQSVRAGPTALITYKIEI